MHLYISTFATHKGGGTAGEYEDASSIGLAGDDSGAPGAEVEHEWNGTQLRIAVADGASEAMLASRWAGMLARDFAHARGVSDLAQVIRRCCSRWPEAIAAYMAEREDAGKPIAWFEEPGLARGSYATVVGLRLSEWTDTGGAEGELHLWALGDACAFVVRDEALVTAFPVDEAEAFGSSPVLASSQPTDLHAMLGHIERRSERWHRGDSIYVVTDAVAHWFLARHEDGESPWQVLRDMGTADGPPDFGDWVVDQREAGLMKNDDATLVRVDIA